MAPNGNQPIELVPDSVVSYLKDRRVIPAAAEATADELGWGISNLVLRVGWEAGCVVIKQSLPKLRVEADWSFDRSRILGEERCMRYLGALLPPGSVPRVVHSDHDNFIFGMSCAPPGGTLWKEALLQGNVDVRAVGEAGTLLAHIHREAAKDPAVADAFVDQTVLIQGRIDPYHLTAARAHPDLAPLIEAEVERLLGTRMTLVLGDYCPKNTFVYPDHLLILDFEVAHWGDPAFDVAFCLNHLILKASRFLERARVYLGAARAFWRAYRSAIEADTGRTEAATVRELGCLLLARIDGKSKIEYIDDDPTKDLVRRVAREILIRDSVDLEQTLTRIGDTLQENGTAS